MHAWKNKVFENKRTKFSISLIPTKTSNKKKKREKKEIDEINNTLFGEKKSPPRVKHLDFPILSSIEGHEFLEL